MSSMCKQHTHTHLEQRPEENSFFHSTYIRSTCTRMLPAIITGGRIMWDLLLSFLIFIFLIFSKLKIYYLHNYKKTNHLNILVMLVFSQLCVVDFLNSYKMCFMRDRRYLIFLKYCHVENLHKARPNARGFKLLIAFVVSIGANGCRK